MTNFIQIKLWEKNESELADIIIRIFNDAFGENFEALREKVIIASIKIVEELKALNTIKKETYFIPRDLLPGSCYFEFQKGKYNTGKLWFSKMGETKLDSSIYLYGNDDGNFDFSAIAPFAYLISGSHSDPRAEKGFDYFGVTYIDKNDGKDLVKNLRRFAILLGEGKEVYEALETMGFYNPANCGTKLFCLTLYLNIFTPTRQTYTHDWLCLHFF